MDSFNFLLSLFDKMILFVYILLLDINTNG